jgi:hypothetical protein
VRDRLSESNGFCVVGSQLQSASATGHYALNFRPLALASSSLSGTSPSV